MGGQGRVQTEGGAGPLRVQAFTKVELVGIPSARLGKSI